MPYSREAMGFVEPKQSLSKKDYIGLATTLSKTRPTAEWQYKQWAIDVCAVADYLEADNSRFNRQKFLFACAGGKINQ